MHTRPAAELFYDRSCGPCTYWARVFRGLSHSQIDIFPLDGPVADRSLARLSTEARYRSFHLSANGKTSSGAGAMPQLLGYVAGPTVERLAAHPGPLRYAVTRMYTTFWEYRQLRGCAAGHPSPSRSS